jgi:superfamily II DNA or RNA helicase
LVPWNGKCCPTKIKTIIINYYSRIKYSCHETEKVQREVEDRTGIRPCIWQIKVVRKVLKGVDVITIAATGSGKSLCYWMVLLYVRYSIIFLVTPLKLLGKQFVETLERNELRAVSILMPQPNKTKPPLQVLPVVEGNSEKIRFKEHMIWEYIGLNIPGPL